MIITKDIYIYAIDLIEMVFLPCMQPYDTADTADTHDAESRGNDTVEGRHESKYIWISDVYSGPGIAKSKDECSIELPLSTDPLCELVQHLPSTMEHNVFPCILTMASGKFSHEYLHTIIIIIHIQGLSFSITR